MNILKVENLKKAYGDNKVLKGVNLSIDSPGIRALVGPNGSGKTTLFSVITNLLKTDSGSVEVLGMKNNNPDIFREISFLKDNTVLYSYLTGLDHLQFIAYAQSLPKSRIDEVCEVIGINNYVGYKTGTYSLGMKQHLLLAMAIMNKPKLMILDEPLNGLDPTSIIKIRKLLKEMANDGTAILLSSHTLSEIDLITSDILFLSEGKIIDEDISRYKTIEYKLLLKDESISKASLLLENNKNITLRASNLIYRTKELDIQKFVNMMTENGIEFTEINKRRIGAEERYKSIFPEKSIKEEEMVNKI